MHTPADRGALFTRLADEAHEIGEGASGYLDARAIIALALKVGAECLHPGYGFLSENADFAESCAKAGVVFIGPPPQAMRAIGLKNSAKALMERAGVPVVPGYHGPQPEPEIPAREGLRNRLSGAHQGDRRRGRARHAAGRCACGVRRGARERDP